MKLIDQYGRKIKAVPTKPALPIFPIAVLCVGTIVLSAGIGYEYSITQYKATANEIIEEQRTPHWGITFGMDYPRCATEPLANEGDIMHENKPTCYDL